MKKRYFIEFSFLGTHYHGWQVQANSITVQQRMEEAFSTVLKQETALTGAGRTDSGVHASYFVAHFDCEEIKDIPQFTSKMNRFLSKDIVLFKIRETFPDAHARFDALSRKYTYVICRKKQAFLGHLAHYHYGKLDIEAMETATGMLKETVDFSSFAKLHSDNKTNICKVSEAQWHEKNDLLLFTIRADRFLRNMIRALTGTLLDVGKQRISLPEFKEIILSKNNQNASASAPAKGLYLSDIKYPESYKLFNPGKESDLPFIC